MINGPQCETPCLWVSKQLRRISACTFMQSDQPSFFAFLGSIISKLAIGEISIFKLFSVVEETGLNSTLSETLKTGFVVCNIRIPVQAPR